MATSEYFFYGAASLGLVACLRYTLLAQVPRESHDDNMMLPPLGGVFNHQQRRKHRTTSCLAQRGVWLGIMLMLLLVAMVSVKFIISLAILKLQTGSFIQQDYEWYGPEIAGRRRFPGVEPYNMSQHCLAPHQISPPPHLPMLRSSIDPALLFPAKPQEHEKRRVRVHVLNLENDMFPFLWDSILIDDEEKEKAAKDQTRIDEKPLRHHFSKLGIEMVLVESMESLFDLPPETVRNVLVVGSYTNNSFLSVLPQKGLSVGMIMLGGEACRVGSFWNADVSLKFTFLTYGDCTLVDNKRFFVWPLGPSTFYGFPPRIEKSLLLSSNQRPLLLNLMASISERKPTRMQALMAAEEICQHHRCQLSQTNMLFKIAESLDRALWWTSATNFRSYFASDQYLQQLMQSKLTLCPSGNTPEQYRIWEAIIAGSIPVVEDPPFEQGHSLHPAFGNNFGCRSDDIHRLLKVNNSRERVFSLNEKVCVFHNHFCLPDAHTTTHTSRRLKPQFSLFVTGDATFQTSSTKHRTQPHSS